MKIHRLRLENFRNHADSTVEFDNLNIIVGKNGQGKSSLKAGLEVLLTGRCREWTDKRGAGLTDLIRTGEKKAVIEADIDGIGQVRRSIHASSTPNRLEIQGKDGTPTMLQDLLFRSLGADADTISAAINTDQFINLSPNEQKEMLFALLGLRFDRDRIWARLHAAYPEVPEALFLSIYPDGLSGGAEVFDVLEKAARERRKDAKRELKSIETRLEGLEIPSLPDGITTGQKSQLVKELRGVRERRDQVRDALTEARVRSESIINMKKRILEWEDKQTAAEQRLAGIKRSDIDELTTSVKKRADAVAALEEKQRNLQQQLATVVGEIDRIDRTVEQLRQAGKRCALTDALECPVSEQDLAKLVSGLEKEKAQANRTAEKLTGQLEQLEQRLTETRRKLAEAQEQHEQALTELKEVQRLEDLVAAAQASAQQFRDAVARLTAEQTKTAVKDLEAELAQLDERLPRGEELLQRLIAVEQLETRQANLMAARETKAAEVAHLETLVEALGPKGLKAAILAETIGTVEEHINRRLEVLTAGEFALRFDLATDFVPLVIHRGVEKPLRILSKSEKQRVGLVLQDALNQLTELGLLVIDDAEIFDPDTRALVSDFLVNVASDYGTIILIAVEDREPTDPGLPGIRVFRVADGQVLTVGTTQEGELREVGV